MDSVTQRQSRKGKNGLSLVSTISLILFFSFSLLISVSTDVSAYRDTIYEKTFDSGDSFNIDGENYEVVVDDDVAIVMPHGSILRIDESECEIRDSLEICAEMIEIEDEYASLSISYVYPEINVDQTLSTTSPSPGEEVEVEVTISNDGIVKSEDVSYEQELPSGLSLEHYSGSLDFSDGVLSWSSSLDAGDEIVLSFTVMVQGSVQDPLQASVDYFDGFTGRTEYSASEDFDVDVPYSMTVSSNETSQTHVGDDVKLTLELENEDDEEAEIQALTLDIPERLSVIESDAELDEENGQFSYHGEVDSDSTISFEIIVRAVSDGASLIEAESDVSRLGNLFSLEAEHEIEAETPDSTVRPYLIIRGSDDVEIRELMSDGEFEGSQQGRLDIYLENPYDHSIDSITMDVVSDYINYSATSGEMTPSSTRRIVKEDHSTPMVNSTVSDEVTVNISYMTSFGYLHEEEVEFDLTYLPIEQIEVTHEFSEQNPESGDNVRISVSAYNPKSSDVSDITFSEQLSRDLDTRGSTQRTTSIDAGEEKEIYEYTMTMPIVSEEREISVGTLLSYEYDGDDFEYSEPFSLNVNPREPDLSLDRSPDRDSVRLGQRLRMSYDVTNENEYPIESISIMFNPGKYGYIRGDPYHTISQLNPGQSRSAENIESLVFFDTSASFDDSRVYFNDDQGTRHSLDISSTNVDVEDDSHNLPRIFFDVSANVTDDIAEYVLNIRNEDEEDIESTVLIPIYSMSERFSESDIQLSGNTNKTFTGNLSVLSDDNRELQDILLRFDHDGETLYATPYDVDVEEIELSEDESPESPYEDPDVVEETEDISEEDTDESDEDGSVIDDPDSDDQEEDIDDGSEKGFIARLWRSFLGLIGVL